MKRITIAAVVLLLLGAGFYFVNNLAADKAAEEINAILTPKLEEIGMELLWMQENFISLQIFNLKLLNLVLVEMSTLSQIQVMIILSTRII